MPGMYLVFAELGCHFKPAHIEAEKVDVFIIFGSGCVLYLSINIVISLKQGCVTLESNIVHTNVHTYFFMFLFICTADNL